MTGVELFWGPVDNLDEFWARYQQDPTPDLRERLLLQYSPLVKFAAGRVPGEPEEVVQRGLEVLTAAIDDFEPGNGSTFESHALSALQDAYSWDSGWAEV